MRFERAHAFYEEYGGITLVAARFVPFLRTFAPFVAGVAQMTRRQVHALRRDRRHAVGGVDRHRGLSVRQPRWVQQHLSADHLGDDRLAGVARAVRSLACQARTRVSRPAT